MSDESSENGELAIELLQELFAYLEEAGFHRTSRLPLVAARQWKWAWEREAWKRFRAGESNLHEVAWPKLYWTLEDSPVRSLFKAVTLGRPEPNWVLPSGLKPLFFSPQRPPFSIVSRFGRFVLRSHPSDYGRDFVYFGDDTLFLMQRSRELLDLLIQSGVPEPSCLDLCCGGGGVGLALPNFEGRLHGIDLNPRAIAYARASAEAQGLANYSYHCTDMTEGLQGRYHLIFGNPPTLSPRLTGNDVFYATGTWECFESLLGTVLASLLPEGRALFTLFSESKDSKDPAFSALERLLTGRRGFTYRVRRVFPLSSTSVLNHCALELLPEGERGDGFIPFEGSAVLLGGVAWRR